MITYEPVQVLSTGQVTEFEPYNGLGVYDSGILVAVYLRHPSSVERRTDKAFAFSTLLIGLILLVGLVVIITNPLLAILYTVTYLLFVYFILNTLVYDDRPNEEELDAAAFAVPEFYAGDVRVIQTHAELINNYPETQR